MHEPSVTGVRLSYDEYLELDNCEQALKAALDKSHDRQLLECVRMRWYWTVDRLRLKFKDAEKSMGAGKSFHVVPGS